LRPRILFLVPADYDRLRTKGVDHLIRERDEGGFFERVVTVHPLATRDRVLDLDAAHRLYEFSLGAMLARGGHRLSTVLVAAYRLIRVCRAIVRLARSERIDIVRATDPYLMGLLGLCVARMLRLPFCVSLHADYEKTFSLTPKQGLARWLRLMARGLPPLVVPRADLLLPVSAYLTTCLERWGANRAAIRVIPHGVDTARFERPANIDARALLGIPADAPIVSWVSRMSGENYSADIPEIVERVNRQRPGAVFVLAGDGPFRDAIASRLSTLGAAVRMIPFQSQDAVIAIRQASAAAICLIGGFSLIEACAAGVPVVAYDVEWHREIVADGESGFIVPERDIAAAVAALDKLLADPARAAAMGCEARRRAQAYDLGATSRIKRDCYQALLETSPNAPKLATAVDGGLGLPPTP
jgi:glycosyltransferase involved in cell wall biosynthesis